MDVLEECGHSDRCRKCRLPRQEMQFGTMSHSAGCRKRMEALVAETNPDLCRRTRGSLRIVRRSRRKCYKRSLASDFIICPSTVPTGSMGADPSVTAAQAGRPVEGQGPVEYVFARYHVHIHGGSREPNQRGGQVRDGGELGRGKCAMRET